jgi:hypothetical protein
MWRDAERGGGRKREWKREVTEREWFVFLLPGLPGGGF